MPNGDYTATKAEWNRIKAFFEKRANVLNKFARDFNLFIDKYYHDSKSWNFRFRHPRGGSGTVELQRIDDSTILITNQWHLDEYETFTRYVKWGNGEQFNVNQVDLYTELKKKLREVVSWTKESMTPYPGYENSWKKYSKEEWAKMFNEERYPIPNLQEFSHGVLIIDIIN